MKKNHYVAVAAARSGGHIIPGLTLAGQYCQEISGARVLVFSTHSAFDKKVIQEYGLEVRSVILALDNVPSRWYLLPIFGLRCVWAFLKSCVWLCRFRPSKVILMGGYVSIPVACAAFLLRIPRDLYELNAVPGNATKLLAPLATHVHVCFEKAQRFFKKGNTSVVAYPIRFRQVSVQQEKLFNNNRKTILILGGSQGSVSLNKSIVQWVNEYPSLCSHINIIHQTGGVDSFLYATMYQECGINAHVFDYHHDLSAYYQLADLVIGRAGAGTIFEALFFKKPLVLVPLELAGNDHQLHNAQAIVEQYPATCSLVRQRDLAVSTGALMTACSCYIQIPTACSCEGSCTIRPVNSSM